MDNGLYVPPGALLYYAFTPNKRQWERQPSIDAMKEIIKAGYIVEMKPCKTPTDYADGLRAVWDHDGNLFNIEHDMAPPVSLIQAMDACPNPLCTAVYWIISGQPGPPLLSACVGPMGTAINGVRNPRIQVGDTSSGFSGIGCCKLSPDVRRQMGPIPSCNWMEVEIYLNRSAYTVAGNWHVHYPVVAHHHGFMEDARGLIPTQGRQGAVGDFDDVRTVYARSISERTPGPHG